MTKQTNVNEEKKKVEVNNANNQSIENKKSKSTEVKNVQKGNTSNSGPVSNSNSSSTPNSSSIKTSNSASTTNTGKTLDKTKTEIKIEKVEHKPNANNEGEKDTNRDSDDEILLTPDNLLLSAPKYLPNDNDSNKGKPGSSDKVAEHVGIDSADKNKSETSKSHQLAKKSYVPALVAIFLLVFLIIASISQRVVTLIKANSDSPSKNNLIALVENKNEDTDLNEQGEVMGAEGQNGQNSGQDSGQNVNENPIPNVPSKNIVEFSSLNPPPDVSAKAYAIVDLTSNSEIYSKNPKLPLPPASVTKIMTAIVALEEYSLDKEVLVPEYCTTLNASKAGLKAYDFVTMQDALYALLVQSGADAACAIANVEGNETEFVEKMNRKANEMGLENTNFQNEIGLDSGNSQYSGVADIVKLSEYALKYDTFRKIVGSKEATINSLNNPQNSYKLKNTNDLLFSLPGSVGIKTGYTTEAGECLSYLYENPSENQKILVVILGSANRFGDTKVLLEWAQNALNQTSK